MNEGNPRTGWRLITPPVGPVLDIDEAKLQCNVEHSRDDDLIYMLVEAATEYIETRGRILSTQVWEMLLDEFPCGFIPVWKYPVQLVNWIEYVDSDGVAQTLDAANYQTALTSEPVRIYPAYGRAWPTVRSQPEAVTIRFTAGYNSSPPTLPKQLLASMKILVGHLYEHRDSMVSHDKVKLTISPAMEILLESAIGRHRVY